MSVGRGQEYLDENFCPHEFVDILDFEIVNAGEDALITIVVISVVQPNSIL